MVCFVVCSFLSPTALAETIASGASGDNLNWTLDNEETLFISGYGDMTSSDGWSEHINEQDATEAAQEAAEQTKDDAEAAAESVSQGAAQIETNKQDIDELRSAFDQIKDTYDDPNVLTDLQDLFGYYVSAGRVTRDSDQKAHDIVFPVVAGKTYFMTLPVANRSGMCGNATGVFEAGSTYTAITPTLNTTNKTALFIVPSDVTYILFYYYYGEYTFSAADFAMYEGTSVPEDLEIIVKKENLPSDIVYKEDLEGVIYGYNPIELTEETGLINSSNAFVPGDSFRHATISVSVGDKLKVSGYKYSNSFPAYLFLNSGTLVDYEEEVSSGVFNNLEVVIPTGVNEIIVNGNATYPVSALLLGFADVATMSDVNEAISEFDPLENTQFWKGKKIVWFGTSIPAGVVNAGEEGGNGAYPDRVGKMLGATMYNESVGSSCVRYGNHNYVTENDPMGLAGQFTSNFLYSLSGSSFEKQAIFDNWNYWKNIINGGAAAQFELTDAIKQRAKECSWDNKLTKYLTGGSIGPVDLYVFDHGHNEMFSEYGGSGPDYQEIGDMPPSNDPMNRTYFIGAMHFIINKILQDNPRARICFIGHYQNDTKIGIADAQEKLANIWKYPLCKTWELIGWSQQTVTINGVTKTITEIWMPDNLHPASDLTGKALQHYARVLYPFMRDVR